MADYYTQYSEVVPGTKEQIEWLLKKFEEQKEDLDHELSISWASTCSKPRLSSFTGGAVAITKKGIAYCSDPADVAMKKLKALRLIMNDSLGLSQ